MRDFARLYQQLDASTATSDKLAALRGYFDAAPADDAAWAAWFLAGGKPRQAVPTALLRALAAEQAGIDAWLFDECYQAVGDLAETIAHVLPPPTASDDAPLAHWVTQELLPLRGLPPPEQAARVAAHWARLDAAGRFLYVKLIGGGFRVGVSRLLVQRALSAHAGLDETLLAQRMMGFTDSAPTAGRWQALLAPDTGAPLDAGQPYPFYLAHALQVPLAELPARLGPPQHWLLEWKYDGIRAQLVRRAGSVWIWSRGEELVTDRFPEIVAAAQALPPGTVLDGEILAWLPEAPQPLPFAKLQQRVARKTLTKKVLAEVPVVFVAYDLLEQGRADARGAPQRQRREALQALLQGLAPDLGATLRLSPLLPAEDWPAADALRRSARERGVEGFMLKHRLARYGVGRRKAGAVAPGEGDLPADAAAGWWKWKLDPLSVDAVLVYAQAGHGRRASVYTDYTFAVWNRPPASAAEAQAVLEAIARREPAPPRDSPALQLVPFAKAYSGLTDEEFRAVDRVIRATTLEKFGPVRSVRPSLVFEIGFEGLNASPRHKSGIAVRFPRMLRLRDDKPLHEADTLAVLQALMDGAPATPAAPVPG
jgi:DNA ligase 1